MNKIVKIKCNICKNEGDVEVKYKLNDKRILLCHNCKTEFLFPQPTFEEIKNIYTSDYYRA